MDITALLTGTALIVFKKYLDKTTEADNSTTATVGERKKAKKRLKKIGIRLFGDLNDEENLEAILEELDEIEAITGSSTRLTTARTTVKTRKASRVKKKATKKKATKKKATKKKATKKKATKKKATKKKIKKTSVKKKVVKKKAKRK